MKDLIVLSTIAAIFIFLAVISKHEARQCLKACAPYEAWSRLTRDNRTCYCVVGDRWELRLINGKRK